MTICPETTRKAYQKRIDEGKTLEDIGSELCNGVKCPRRKAIRIVKQVLGEDFLIANSEKLGYDAVRSGAKTKMKKAKQKMDSQNLSEEPQTQKIQSQKPTATEFIESNRNVSYYVKIVETGKAYPNDKISYYTTDKKLALVDRKEEGEKIILTITPHPGN